MNYTLEVTINKPIQDVVTFFNNPENYPLWMEGLKEHTVVKGEAGEEGAESAFVFDMKGRTVEITGTVLLNNLPEKHVVEYNSPGMKNRVEFSFFEVNDNLTKLINYNEFEFSGFMKFIAFLMPGSFKKQSMKYVQDFKKFAEST